MLTELMEIAMISERILKLLKVKTVRYLKINGKKLWWNRIFWQIGDHNSNIRSAEIRIKEKEVMHFGVKKDIKAQNYTNSNMRSDLNDYLAEKEAMERHCRILLGQNDDLTKELERFVNTDEVLR